MNSIAAQVRTCSPFITPPIGLPINFSSKLLILPSLADTVEQTDERTQAGETVSEQKVYYRGITDLVNFTV